jgi:hypothetical protein
VELLSRYGVATDMTRRHDDILKAIRYIARQVEAATERSSWSVTGRDRGARGEILPGFSEVHGFPVFLCLRIVLFVHFTCMRDIDRCMHV